MPPVSFSKMTAADPTYPAYPIACSLATVMMMLVLFANFAQQSWNRGIAFLCIWSCLNNLISAVNAIAWSDNVDVKLYAWCDITSRMSIATGMGTYMAPLLITRRLSLIAGLQSVLPRSRRARRWDQAVEWTLGFVWPLVSAGPLYLVVEASRFQVIEGIGCSSALEASILMLVLTQIWTVLPPIISVSFYYRKLS
ncbi:hypothetical protein PENSPDRAFT_483853 [Peniophora sp. CONT]|nr:hypothetical protein PENSPDRAFT_483853 [Peniophora sp. CONT]